MTRPALRLAALVLLAASLGHAGPAPRPTRRPALKPLASSQKALRRAPAQPNRQFSSLQSRLGLAVAERLLRSDAAEDRLQALERLGNVGTPRALELLVRAIDNPGTPSSAIERLAAVRALFPHAKRLAVRQALLRLMVSAGARSSERREPMEAQVRQAAALALAASHEREALIALGSALRQEGAMAAAAGEAVKAHPPPDLTPLLEAGRPSMILARTLGELGDQRAFSALRRFVRYGADDVRIEAAIALTRLGDLETAELARNWLGKSRFPEQKQAAAEILALSHSPEWPAAIEHLLGDPSSAAAGLDLAKRAPHPRLVPALARLLSTDDSDAPAILAAIGRAGGPSAARFLGRNLASTQYGSAAAYALALAEGDEATRELERAFDNPTTRALALRAAVVRSASLGETAHRLRQALEHLLAGPSADARALGAWGVTVLDVDRGSEFLRSSEPAIVRAVARLARRGRLAQIAAERLASETDPLTLSALATCLADESAANAVPTHVLERLQREAPAAAPLAVRALAMRDDRDLRPWITALLESGDEWLRAHAALGLGYSRSPSALGILARRYRLEPSAEVRGAIVAALARLAREPGKNTLWLAAMLDPDQAVRERARIALAGRERGTESPAHGTFWLRLASTDASVGTARALAVRGEFGLALPATSDPGGFLALTGLPEGPITLRLADAPQRNNAWTR